VTESFKKNLNEPLIKNDYSEDKKNVNVKKRKETFDLIGFELTETKIIVWSSNKIFYCNLVEAKQTEKLVLKSAPFALNTHGDEAENESEGKLHFIET